MIEEFLPVQSAWAQQGTQAPPGGGMGFLLLMLVFFGLMYFMMIRPQMKRAREHRDMIKALQKGDEVAINGGVLGRIRDIGDNYLLVELARNVEVRVQKQAVSSVLPKGTLKTL